MLIRSIEFFTDVKTQGAPSTNVQDFSLRISNNTNDLERNCARQPSHSSNLEKNLVTKYTPMIHIS